MKIYIYPTYTPSRDKSGNLYIKYFHDAFNCSREVRVLNRFWKIGITSIIANLDADVFIIQWVDLIPGKRLGKIQLIFYFLLVCVLKLLHKKIIWILHNKRAHNGTSCLVDYSMDFMAKKATHVVTHSEEGVIFFNQRYPKYVGKCIYIPHPIYTSKMFESKPIKYDYIIWGSINKRKNVLEFFKYVSTSDYMQSKKILLCGRCSDKAYCKELNNVITQNVTFINRFLSDGEIQDYISESKIILFTYNGESVLSSGALIYSLNFNKNIIGPKVGSFADLSEIVNCYEKFEEIEYMTLLDNKNAIKKYIKENTWEAFPNKILGQIKNN